MPDVYAKQGFVREEIMNMTQFERESGVIHEASNFSPGNESLPYKEPSRPETPPEVTADLVNDLRAAIASGPWTDSSPDSPPVFTAAVPLGKS